MSFAILRGSCRYLGQIAWGLRYIADRYGTPANAYGAWLGRRPHWYATGGTVGHPVTGGAPTMVRTMRETVRAEIAKQVTLRVARPSERVAPPVPHPTPEPRTVELHAHLYLDGAEIQEHVQQVTEDRIARM